MNMRRMILGLAAGVISLLLMGCGGDQPLSPSHQEPGAQPPAQVSLQAGAANEQACWGQASAVFARTGEMGEHSSQFDTPRLGLRNLARLLYEAGLIEDDTMQALGAYVAAALDLSIAACGT